MAEEPEFPPNSEASKGHGPPHKEKKVESVVTGGVKVNKKSLRKQFTEVFIAGDFKSAVQSGIFDVLLPAAKDTAVDMGTQFLERLFHGEGRRRGARPPMSGNLGPIPYNHVYGGSMSSRFPNEPARALSRQARARHDFGEIVLENRSEAEHVIDQLFELADRYGYAQVADLYDLVGVSSAHTDSKWGWTDLAGASVSRTRGGYLLNLPNPQPL